ncbi:hypothetical protein J6590_065263 [Homalodisca vitripennis]|nr:hypothetical protein J6590_065263 [Homalodisca vitripennis]
MNTINQLDDSDMDVSEDDDQDTDLVRDIQNQPVVKDRKKYITVPQPQVIKAYNTHMGGVDMSDRMLSYCSSRQRTRNHIQFLALLPRRQDQVKHTIKKLAQLRKYKMDYGEYLIESNSILSDSEDSEYLTDEEVTPGRNPKELPSVRFRTHGNHLPEITPGVQQRCKNSKCSKKTSTVKITDLNEHSRFCERFCGQCRTVVCKN